MNGSSSPSRESSLIRPRFLLPSVALAVTSFLAPGCRSTPKKQSEAVSTPAALPVLTLGSGRDAAAQWFKPEATVAVVAEGSIQREVIRLMASSCRNPAGDSATFLSRWELDLETPFGVRPVRFTVSRYGVKVLVRAFIGQESVEFISSLAVPDEWMVAACSKALSPAEMPIAASKEVMDAIGGWLAGFAPDCNATLQQSSPETGAWKCQPTTPDIASTMSSLDRTRHTMISGWTRQPYLLARRVAIGINLAEALQDSASQADPRPALKNACSVIRRSLRTELPLVLDDPRIVDTFCNEMATPVAARAMALVVASKIASEVGSLRYIFENTSKSGTLTVNLPPSDLPGSTFLVTLKPEEDVVLGLAKFTQAMLIERQNAHRAGTRLRASAEAATPAAVASDASQDPSAVLGYACWQPLFDSSHKRLLIAQELGLMTAPNQSACIGREGPGSGGIEDVTWTPQRYVAESITSDTEFLVTNGETKVLRLPAGTYSFTVQLLQQVPSAIEDSAMPAAPMATGKIEWLSAKPRAVIKESATAG